MISSRAFFYFKAFHTKIILFRRNIKPNNRLFEQKFWLLDCQI